MADSTTVSILTMSGENIHFPVSKQTVGEQLSLDVLGNITHFTHGEQAIANCSFFPLEKQIEVKKWTFLSPAGEKNPFFDPLVEKWYFPLKLL